MPETIFHKIARKEAPAYIVAEDADHIAFLDIFPNVKGQTVVIPKKFQPGKFSAANTPELLRLVEFAQKVAQKIETRLAGVLRCQVVIEGFQIDYMHIKLFPAFKLPDDMVHHGSSTLAKTEELEDVQRRLTA